MFPEGVPDDVVFLSICSICGAAMGEPLSIAEFVSCVRVRSRHLESGGLCNRFAELGRVEPFRDAATKVSRARVAPRSDHGASPMRSMESASSDQQKRGPNAQFCLCAKKKFLCRTASDKAARSEP